MPTPEEVKKELQQYENPTAHEDLLSRLRELPSELQEFGLAFVEGASSRGRDEELQRKNSEAKRAIVGLNEKDRHKLFAALFPSIADHVEASWQLQMKLPYQTGYLRKAFRAPQSPEYTADARIQWLEQLLNATQRYRYDLEFLMVWATFLKGLRKTFHHDNVSARPGHVLRGPVHPRRS